MDIIIIICPHCKDFISIHKSEINCSIFRHGIFKNTFIQIDPHLNKINCDKLVFENLIFGCGKPFRLNKINNEYNPEICDYI